MAMFLKPRRAARLVSTLAAGLALLVVAAACSTAADAEDQSHGRADSMAIETNPKHTNGLAEATSPYLLQHAHNPVNWQEWGPAALERARAGTGVTMRMFMDPLARWPNT